MSPYCYAAGLVVVGTAKGEVVALTARDPTAIGKDTAHETIVTAMVRRGHGLATSRAIQQPCIPCTRMPLRSDC